MQSAAPLNTRTSRIPSPRVQVSKTEPKSRDDLLLLATSRFCAAERHNRLTSDQYKEAFYLLINEVSTATKARISRTLSSCDYTPRQVAIYFALEHVEIATPMLRNSRVLGQLDLLQVADTRSEDHSVLIAGRPDIGPTLIQRLRRMRSKAVSDALSENYAVLDESLKRDADSLFELIDKRSKKTKIAEREVQQVAQTPVQAPRETVLRPSLEDAHAPTAIESTLLAAAARGGRLSDQQKLEAPAPVTTPDIDYAASLERAALARSHQGMAVLMRKQSGISLETAFQALSDKTGDTLCVYMRAYEMEEALANRILLLAFPTIGLSVRNAMRSVKFYNQLTVENCKQAVAKWPRKAASHQPYMEESAPARGTQSMQIKAVEWASDRPARATG